MNRTARMPLVALLVATSLTLAACDGDDEPTDTAEGTAAATAAAPEGEPVPGTAQLRLADGTIHDLVIDGDCDVITDTNVSLVAFDDLLTVNINVARGTGTLLAEGMLEAEGVVDQIAVDQSIASLSGTVTVEDDTAEPQRFHLAANCNHPES